MSVKKMMEAYTKTDHTNVVEGNDPVAIVALLFDELIRAMQDFIQHSDPEKGKKDVRSRQFSRSLTIIYALQTSLNFEEGGDIANNLFQLYEFGRVKLIEDLGKGVANGSPQAIEVIASIRDSWEEMGKQIGDEK